MLTVTLTVRVVSDKIAGNGYNYGKVDVTRAFTFTVPDKDKRHHGDHWDHTGRTGKTGRTGNTSRTGETTITK